MSRPIVLALALALVGAGCGTGGLPSPVAGSPGGASPDGASAAVSPAATTIPASVAPTRAGSSAPEPTTVPTAGPASGPPVAPPVAQLAGPDSPPGGAIPGVLGAYTWGAQGTEAPWIVPPGATGLAPGVPITVTFAPEVLPESWVARWAPVSGDAAGDVVAGVDGTGTVTLDGPRDAGTWGLQLEARFGGGRSATWYWRVEVGG